MSRARAGVRTAERLAALSRCFAAMMVAGSSIVASVGATPPPPGWQPPETDVITGEECDVQIRIHCERGQWWVEVRCEYDFTLMYGAQRSEFRAFHALPSDSEDIEVRFFSDIDNQDWTWLDASPLGDGLRDGDQCRKSQGLYSLAAWDLSEFVPVALPPVAGWISTGLAYHYALPAAVDTWSLVYPIMPCDVIGPTANLRVTTSVSVMVEVPLQSLVVRVDGAAMQGELRINRNPDGLTAIHYTRTVSGGLAECGQLVVSFASVDSEVGADQRCWERSHPWSSQMCSRTSILEASSRLVSVVPRASTRLSHSTARPRWR